MDDRGGAVNTVKTPVFRNARAGRAVIALFVIGFLALVPVPALLAQDTGDLSVSSTELQSASGADLVFVNYEGPQSRVETAAEITAIGTGLGSSMPKDGSGQGLRRGDLARYAVIRAIDPSVKTGLEADIIVIGPDAQVDHVKNLRRIIAGYLVAAWGYSAKDAATLAVYVTVYNAVHRGDMGYFSGKYKPVVTKELSAANAGLSLRYDEWAGKSRIVIPLARGAKPGAIGAIDTGAVSDKATTDSLRAQPDASLGDRQAMTELKDREAEQRAAALAAEQAAIAADEAALAAQKAAIADQQAALDKVRAEEAQAAAKGAAPAAATPAAKAADATAGGTGATAAAGEKGGAAGTAAATAPAGQAGAAQTASIADQEAALKAAQEKAAADEAALAAKKAAADADAAALAAKKDEAAADRATIAADQQAVITADVAAKAAGEANGIFLYQLIDASGPYARVVFVDATTGKLIRASTVNTLRPRAVVDSGDSLVAVAGKEGGSGAVRLVRLAKRDLAQTAEGKTDLFADSALWQIGASFYAVAKGKDGKYYLASFGADLVETARSTQAVNPYTALVQGKDGLVVQGAGGSFLVVSPDKLSVLRELKP
jgi:hypothetical protein